MCTNNSFLITSSENIIPMITRSKTFKNFAYLSISAPLKKNNKLNAFKRRKEIESVGRRSPSICVGPHLQMLVSIYMSPPPSTSICLGLQLHLQSSTDAGKSVIFSLKLCHQGLLLQGDHDIVKRGPSYNVSSCMTLLLMGL